MRSAIALLVLCCAAISVGAREARAQTFPRDDQWRVLECDGVPSFDPVGDEPGAIDERDVVGDAAQPALYYFADAQYVFFRMRVDADPRDRMQLRASGWAAELDTDIFLETYELFAAANGAADPDEVILARNTTQRPRGDPADPPETTVATYDARTHARGIEATGAFASSFGGDADFFVDWAIARDDLAAEGVVAATPLALVMGTSSDAAGIDADLACHDGSTGNATLIEIFTDRVTPSGVLVLDADGDGYPDEVEIAAGTDPNDASSFPRGPGSDGGTSPPPAGSDSGLHLRGGGGPAGGCAVARLSSARTDGALGLTALAGLALCLSTLARAWRRRVDREAARGAPRACHGAGRTF